MKRISRVISWSFLISVLLSLNSCSTLPIIHWSHKKEHATYLRGVFHVHSQFSHDSTGSLEHIVSAAKRLDLDFVVITDHNNINAHAKATAMNRFGAPLLIVGNEISTTDGHLISLGTDYVVNTPVEPQKAIDLIREHGGYSVIAHPVCERAGWKDWSVDQFDGIEIYNYACDFYQSNKISFFLKSLLLTPHGFVRQTILEPHEALRKWDLITRKRFVPALAAADAHEQFGFGNFHLIRYDLSFRSATLYLPKTDLNESDILKTIFSGKGFIVFESFGQPQKFIFTAHSAYSNYQSGEFINEEGPVTLHIELDRSGEIRLLKNGEIARIKTGKTLTVDSVPPGLYRVEIYKNGRLWIVSNPISIHASN